MKKKNVAQSAHSDDVRDHVPDKESRNDQLERLARTFFGSSSSQHIRTVDGKVESNSIKHNNPGTDFTNQLKQFENNLPQFDQIGNFNKIFFNIRLINN